VISFNFVWYCFKTLFAFFFFLPELVLIVCLLACIDRISCFICGVAMNTSVAFMSFDLMAS